jgi:hypothetical protein
MILPMAAGVSPFFSPLPANTLGNQPSYRVPIIAKNCSLELPLDLLLAGGLQSLLQSLSQWLYWCWKID